jgi:serine/threonine-protein kinase
VSSFKSRGWQLGLTAVLLGLTYALSLTSTVVMFEYDIFLYIIGLQSASRELVAIESLQLAPQWSLILIYGLILVVYAHRCIRSRTTAVPVLTVMLILFALLMLEVILAVFMRLFLPVVFPVLAILLVLLIYRVAERYQGYVISKLVWQESISLSGVRACIDKGDLRTALTRLKQCPYSDELLEVGYELGVLLESGKHLASALNLYQWLSKYDPGLSDFVDRIKEILNHRETLIKLSKSNPVVQSRRQTIGHYCLLKKIATGSTAVVYEATDMRSHNRVALKVMRVVHNEKVERARIKHWLHEAEIVSQLDHDNIVKIHDAEMQGEKAYIAMDYISGYSMSLRLRKREYLTVGECIRISKAMLHALAVAHSHGIIHGDIKPANIMYDSVNDTYILTDFGAAYSDRREYHNENTIVGTPAYMSPEQLEGKKLDGRSDLFSLAVTLYHLLTGNQPFSGNSLPELKQNVVRSEPDLDHLTLPVGITEVIAKALQKKPYMRFADAQQMLTSVEHCEKQLRERMNQQD